MGEILLGGRSAGARGASGVGNADVLPLFELDLRHGVVGKGVVARGKEMWWNAEDDVLSTVYPEPD